MLDKFEYYHGAAIVRILEDERCHSIQRRELLGYVVNQEVFIFLKYTTRSRSPWGFTFDQEDVDRCVRMSSEYKRVVIGMVCGGDGIFALDWDEAKNLLAEKPGRISGARKHNHSYSVWGTAGELKNKIAINRWPSLVFETKEIKTALPDINATIYEHGTR